jgi:hypothetical protein
LYIAERQRTKKSPKIRFSQPLPSKGVRGRYFSGKFLYGMIYNFLAMIAYRRETGAGTQRRKVLNSDSSEEDIGKKSRPHAADRFSTMQNEHQGRSDSSKEDIVEKNRFHNTDLFDALTLRKKHPEQWRVISLSSSDEEDNGKNKLFAADHLLALTNLQGKRQRSMRRRLIITS